MPKKRTYNFKPLQGPSSSTNKQASANKNGSDASPSVNERLSELRRLGGKDAAAKKRLLAESVNQRSVPPEVRGILGVPESAPPKPKTYLRMRDRMRTPGPAPPKSWLTSSSGAWTSFQALPYRRRGMKHGADPGDRDRPRHILRFARLAGLEGDDIDARPASLTHLALKAIAASWDLLDEEDYPTLADIPLRLRLRLLAFIDFYGPPISYKALKALLQGSEDITNLDLAGLIGHNDLSLKKVYKLLEKELERAANKNEDDVVESWDADEPFEASLQVTRLTTRFSNLTHLCLSHPAPGVSWKDLLRLSKLTPQVTHLSLAYWPRPTLTPNLSTTSVSSQHSPDVTAGGSHYYSTLDQDMTEPASLLRQLSGNLLCLQWLDLEGCHQWVPALGTLAQDTIAVSVNESVPQHDDWTANSHNVPSIFTSNWKNLNYIRCSQGWLPSLTGIQGLSDRREASAIDALLVDGVRKHLQQEGAAESEAGSLSQDLYDIEKKKARMWLECEYKLTYACMRINSARRTHGCKPVGVDFGWIQRHKVVPNISLE